MLAGAIAAALVLIFIRDTDILVRFQLWNHGRGQQMESVPYPPYTGALSDYIIDHFDHL